MARESLAYVTDRLLFIDRVSFVYQTFNTLVLFAFCISIAYRLCVDGSSPFPRLDPYLPFTPVVLSILDRVGCAIESTITPP